MSTLTIGQVAARTGAAPSALRYWEDLGLIHSVRTAGNQRRYERATIRRVSFIRAAQRVGLSLDEIARRLPEARVA
jgi:MerR family redox-sensitive transcriptional activator SoxR